jgi:hypothetical protein
MTVQSPAFGIAYGIWARNKKGYIVCAAGLAAMAIFYPALFAYSRTPATLIGSTIPVVGIFTYVLNSLIFAQQPGNLSSSYPRHMLVLPVRSRTLVFWPIFIGSLLATCLWLFTAMVIYRTSGLEIPVAMPALVMVVLVTWFLALAWTPLSDRWIRDLIGITLSVALGALPMWMIIRDPGARAAVTVVLVIYLVAAGALAIAGVKADRRGDLWSLSFWQATRPWRTTRPPRARPFASPALAQFWYEWRCHGLGVVGCFGLLMLIIWGCVLSGRKPIDAHSFPLIFGLLLAGPIVTFGSLGPAIGRLRPAVTLNREYATFLTTRPIQSGAVVAAKMRMALVTILFSWAYILAGTALCVVLSRSTPAAIATWNRLEQLYPGGTAQAICGLALILLPALTLRQLTDGFPLMLTGRKWIEEAAAYVFIVVLLGLASGGAWLGKHPDQLPRVLAAVPWIVAVGALVKAALATVAFHSAIRRGLISWGAFWRIFGCWVSLAGVGITLLILVDPRSALVPKPAMFLGIATAVPLSRFPLSALAFDWNRHR